MNSEFGIIYVTQICCKYQLSGGFYIRPTSVCEMPRIITKTDLFSKDKSHENRSFCLYYKISRRETENCSQRKIT